MVLMFDVCLQILGSNPMFANNPQLRDQFQQNLPQMVEQVSILTPLALFFQYLSMLSVWNWI